MKTLKELSTLLKNKEISSAELIKDHLAYIQTHNLHTNSFITISEETALEKAYQADQLLQNGKATELTGIPIAHKDIFCTEGVKTTCASKMLDNFIAPYSATLVNKLEQAGAVSLGKLNMDEFAMGSTSESGFYGSVKNPWDLSCIAGGSSGGSAAAVAAGLIPAATGSDTGGSIRQPAALCGITGLKPTYGRISRFGMIAYASSLDQAGPLAKTAEDCALMLNYMAGFDPKDSTSIARENEDFTAHLHKTIQGLKIGIPKSFFSQALDSQMADSILSAINLYKSLGAELVEVDLPHNAHAISAYYVIASAECSSNLSRFDGVRFGHRCEQPVNLEDLYKRSRAEGFGSEVKRRILLGTYALSSGYYEAYYQKAQRIRRLIAEDYQKAFQACDVIMGPVTPRPAFKLGTSVHDPIQIYLEDIYTLSVNLAGLPAMSIPAGFIHHLPIGLQLIGPAFSEAKLLNIAHQFQQASDHHLQTPSKQQG